MYHQYFGLSEPPFSIAVNPRYLFMSPRHRDALAHLLYGVGAGGGFILLTGEVGTGKTTINRCLLEQLPDDTDVAIILNPALNAPELLATACDELGIERDKNQQSLKHLTDCLHQYLLENHARGRRTVLMIDEAQHLDFDVLEQIRLLTNLETNSEKLLQIILIGQPELVALLNRPELRQLNQRITARYNLEPLNAQETAAYVRHRLQVAGLAPGRELFPHAVLKRLHKLSSGIPRVINLLCDRMLLGAYGRNQSTVDNALLTMAAKEVLGDGGNKAAAGNRSALSAVLVVVSLLVVAGLGYVLSSPSQTPVQASSQQAVAAPPPTPVEQAPAPSADQMSSATGDWLLPPQQALAQLWQLQSDDPQVVSGCHVETVAGLACIAERADTWEALRELNRPLVLEVVSAQGFMASALLVAIEGRNGWLLRDGALVRLSLAEVGARWQGGYQFLWHPPEGFSKPLSRGDRGPAVAAIATLFAQLDTQESALASSQFNAALETRVRLFQRQQGLEDDGVVGLRTLLRLNALLGIDLNSAAALAQYRKEGANVSDT